MELSKERIQQLRELEKTINYRFKDLGLLHLAFIHSSYANEDKRRKKLSNERLEFLGDAVMELVVSDFLYQSKKELPEGSMTRVRSQVVCEKSFANLAKKLGLGQFLLMGRGEEQSGGRQRPSVLADSFEALCGAIFIDAGFEECQEIIRERLFDSFQAEVKECLRNKDFKTELQEYCQQKSNSKLLYRCVGEKGPDHDKVFFIEVVYENQVLGQGQGKSKKAAEQAAAQEALVKLGLE